MRSKEIKLKTKPKKITPLPREPLTQKARAAITKFVTLEGEKKGNFVFVLIKAVLKAERMKRADLYTLLEARGFTWKPRAGWVQAKPKSEAKQP